MKKAAPIVLLLLIFIPTTQISATIPTHNQGEVIKVQTGILNPGEVDIIYSRLNVSLITETGTPINVGEYESREQIAPGAGLYVELFWNSSGAPLGLYDIQLTGFVEYATHDIQQIDNLIEDDFRLLGSQGEESYNLDFDITTLENYNPIHGPYTDTDKEALISFTLTNTGTMNIIGFDLDLEIICDGNVAFNDSVILSTLTPPTQSALGILNVTLAKLPYGTFDVKLDAMAMGEDGSTAMRTRTEEAVFTYEERNLDFIQTYVNTEPMNIYQPPKFSVTITNTGNQVITSGTVKIELIHQDIAPVYIQTCKIQPIQPGTSGSTMVIFDEIPETGIYDVEITTTVNGDNSQTLTKTHFDEAAYDNNEAGPDIDIFNLQGYPLATIAAGILVTATILSRTNRSIVS